MSDLPEIERPWDPKPPEPRTPMSGRKKVLIIGGSIAALIVAFVVFDLLPNRPVAPAQQAAPVVESNAAKAVDAWFSLSPSDQATICLNYTIDRAGTIRSVTRQFLANGHPTEVVAAMVARIDEECASLGSAQ